jgi:hypothetical protein
LLEQLCFVPSLDRAAKSSIQLSVQIIVQSRSLIWP